MRRHFTCQRRPRLGSLLHPACCLGVRRKGWAREGRGKMHRARGWTLMSKGDGARSMPRAACQPRQKQSRCVPPVTGGGATEPRVGGRRGTASAMLARLRPSLRWQQSWRRVLAANKNTRIRSRVGQARGGALPPTLSAMARPWEHVPGPKAWDACAGGRAQHCGVWKTWELTVCWGRSLAESSLSEP